MELDRALDGRREWERGLGGVFLVLISFPSRLRVTV